MSPTTIPPAAEHRRFIVFKEAFCERYECSEQDLRRWLLEFWAVEGEVWCDEIVAALGDKHPGARARVRYALSEIDDPFEGLAWWLSKYTK